MSDLIDRQAALDSFKLTNTRAGARHAIEALPSAYCDVEDIPSAQQCEIAAYVEDCDACHFCDKQQWIPCSERFPEQGVEVLVTWTNGVDIAHWDVWPDGRYWDFGEFWLKEWEGEVHDVIAWMPLPEPYTEEQT